MIPPIRVMLVDDHTMVRRGLATFLKVFDDLELVGEAADGETAVQLCGEVLPDVILMDMVMPDVDGATATRLIRQRFPTVQVIALTSFKEEGLVQSALQAGAIGYLLKDVLADELAEAIRAARAGQGTLSPQVIQIMTHAADQPTPSDHAPDLALDLDLTERELEVLALLVTGLNNSEIAEKLVVSPSTVKSHVSNILAKFGVASRTEVAVAAVRRGLIV
jgi:NarL family two-component system response regulator LiaR